MVKIPLRHGLLAVVLLLAVGGLGAVCGHDFIGYDDEINIYGNRLVTSFSLANIRHFWAGPFQNLYIPLTYTLWVILAKIAAFWPGSSGDSVSSFPFHAANLLLHLGGTVLVFQIIRTLLKDDWGAAGGALLFALHPLQIEAVAWATGLKDVLSGFLALLALWQYVKSVEVAETKGRRYRHYAIASVAFAGAILAKPGALVLPLAVGLIGLLLMRPPRLMFRELSPWLLAAIPVLLVTTAAQPAAGQNFSPTAWQRLLVAGDAWTFYLGKLVFPWQLGPDYGRTPQMVLGQGWRVWLNGFAPYLLLPLALWRCNRFWRVAIGYSLLMILPVSGLVTFKFQDYSTVADRYFYPAMLGPALGLGWLVFRYRSRPLIFGGIAIILLSFGVRSWLQVDTWASEVAFYQNALKVNPRSWMAANNLGVIYSDRHELDTAGRLLEQAIAWKPDYVIALNNLGAVHGLQGRLAQAQDLFARAIALDPNYADPVANLADVYLRRGEVTRAREQYQRALAVKPDFARVHAALGDIASRDSQPVQALEHYQSALEYGPASVKILNNLGLVYTKLGRSDAAAECYRRALAMDPEAAEVHNNLGLLQHEAGRYREAIASFEEAGRLRPDQPQPFSNLGKALLAAGQIESARAAFLQALALDQGYAPALSGLARLYRLNGRTDLADDYHRRAKALGYSEE